MKQIIECVPNFSEGRNMKVIDSIADSIEEAGGVKVLNVDPGAATNRTVITFAGSPESVVEAAFQAVKKAGELIDMRLHHGAHPRLGATDVLPLVPVPFVCISAIIIVPVSNVSTHCLAYLCVDSNCLKYLIFSPSIETLLIYS